MEGFFDAQNECPQSEQHHDHISDSFEDSISDEDALAPTGLSLACAASKLRERSIKIDDHDEAATWNEVLEEADELAYMHKEPPSAPSLSGRFSRRGRTGNKLKFSIRGSWSVALNEKIENSYFGEQEALSGNLAPPTKASETMMTELLENLKKETEDLPLEFACPNKKANVSVAELLEDLQDKSGPSSGTPIFLNQHTKTKEWRPKVHTSGSKTLALLNQMVFDSDDPLEHITGETSSEEEEDIGQNHLALSKIDVKGYAMVDLFQEAFSAASMEGATFPVRLNGIGYCGRIQQVVQMEKDKHAEFLRQLNRGQGDLKGNTVEILSRSLEGKLTVCHCLFKEKSKSPLSSKGSTDCNMNHSSIKRTVIFSSKICDKVELVAGNIVHIYPPWKEVLLKEEEVILCTYFSHHGV